MTLIVVEETISNSALQVGAFKSVDLKHKVLLDLRGDSESTQPQLNSGSIIRAGAAEIAPYLYIASQHKMAA